MAKGSRSKAGKGRRAKTEMPARIPDTPENVVWVLLNTPPKSGRSGIICGNGGPADGKDA